MSTKIHPSVGTNGSAAFDRPTLRQARHKLGLSQAQLAVLAGSSQTAVSTAERGGYASSALLVRLGTVLLVLNAFREPLPDDVQPPHLNRDLDGDLTALVSIGDLVEELWPTKQKQAAP